MKQKKKIFNSILLLLLLLLNSGWGCSSAFAQKQKTEKDYKIVDGKKIVIPQDTLSFYQGASLGVDIFGIANKALGGDFISSEVMLEFDLKHRFFPIIELGYGKINTTDDDVNIHYKTSGPYARLGLNYNLQYKKQRPGYLYLGLRYGVSSFSFDVEGPNMVDPIWKTEVPFSYKDLKTTVHWAEIVIGLRAKVFSNFHMGWALRYKMRLNQTAHENAQAHYIPGFGINNATRLGITYNLVYKLPFQR